MTSWSSPQPFKTVDHTADVGVRVCGDSAEEALARLLLAHAQLVCAGNPVVAHTTRQLTIAGSEDWALMAVDALREVHRWFCTTRQVAQEVEVVALSNEGLRLSVAVGDYDPLAHSEGVDIKAVTYHQAQLERRGKEWIALVIFDV